MKFNNCKLSNIDPFVDAFLYMNYKKKAVFNASIGSDCKYENGYKLTIVYKLTFHTQENELIQTYTGSYKCDVEREGQSEADEKIDLWEHIKTGLTRSLLVANGNDATILNEVDLPKKWHGEIDSTYTALIQCVR